MSGVTITKFRDNGHGVGEVYYRLKVDERYNRISADNYRDSLRKSTAENVVSYGRGSIDVGDFHIEFDSAFHFKANLHLRRAKVQHLGSSYFSPELVFSPHQQTLTAERLQHSEMQSNGRVLNRIRTHVEFKIDL